MASFTISKLNGGLSFNMLVNSRHINSPLLMPLLLRFFRGFMNLKGQLSILDPRMKEVKGIQKKGQDRGALIKT